MRFHRITKAIIPVAGLGTRMLPATKEIPKELLPILDKPLIQHVVEEAVSAGISEIIFVTRKGKNEIKRHFLKNVDLEDFLIKYKKKEILKKFPNNFLKKIKYFSVYQKEPLGLGDAILTAKKFIKEESFAVFLPDEFLMPKNLKKDFQRMIERYQSSGKSQILVEEIPKKLVSQYGIVKLSQGKLTPNKSLDISDIEEKPNPSESPSRNRVVGRYILPVKIFEYIKTTKPGKSNEIQLTDAIKKFLKENNNSFQATLSNSDIFDCGSIKGFVGANIALGSKDKKIKNYLKEIIN
tara:strand:+ start:339 stop:1223 length:885 start_codon:yes stop_codon:yes gene_type:complete